MRRFLLQNVISDRLHFDHDARVRILLLLDDRHNVRRYVRLDVDRIETVMHVDLLFDVLDRHVDEFRELDDHFFLDRLGERQ